ncbi:MAG: long-chain fatty acid--CoA ligase, partial [Bacteroidales bacterium]|nr:long-chain fatty acid--CoA ligase [Bacteroidales bacterium]
KINGKDKTSYFQCLAGIIVTKDKHDCLSISPESLGINQLQTNDITELISPTRFKILGRIDFMINSGGLKINPEQLEMKITHLIQQPFMIGYKNDPSLGQRVVLLLESKEYEKEEEILQQIKKVLPSNQVPKEIYYINELLWTANHKLDRKRNNLYLNS